MSCSDDAGHGQQPYLARSCLLTLYSLFLLVQIAA
jgi:hypothetical protein